MYSKGLKIIRRGLIIESLEYKVRPPKSVGATAPMSPRHQCHQSPLLMFDDAAVDIIDITCSFEMRFPYFKSLIIEGATIEWLKCQIQKFTILSI